MEFGIMARAKSDLTAGMSILQPVRASPYKVMPHALQGLSLEANGVRSMARANSKLTTTTIILQQTGNLAVGGTMISAADIITLAL
jgi:hypothetical protein